LLNGAAPAHARAIHERAAYRGSIPSRWIVPECCQKAGSITRIEPDRGVGRSAVLAQPRFEAGDRLRFDWRGCCGDGPANPPLAERSWEEAGAPHGVGVSAAPPPPA